MASGAVIDFDVGRLNGETNAKTGRNMVIDKNKHSCIITKPE